MCTRDECISRLTEATPVLRKEYGVKSMRLFGSMARGDNRADSDVDVLVEMPPKMFQLIGMKQYLRSLLGLNVDVVRMHPGIDTFLLSQIERDGVTIFT